MRHNSGVAVGQRWQGETGGVQHAEGVTLREGCVTLSPPPRGWECKGDRGFSLTRAAHRFTEKPAPRYFIIPSLALSGEAEAVQRVRGESPPPTPIPTSPSSQKHCSATAMGLAPVHSPGGTPRDPPAPIPATTDAAVLNKLLCRRARLGREVGH